MNSIFQFISEETIHALAWTVLHSLWQGLLIALIFSLIYYNLKNKTARFKYHLSFASLLAIVLSAAYTFMLLSSSMSSTSYVDYTVPTTVLSSSDSYQLALTEKTTNWFDASLSYLDANASLVVGIWMAGMFVFVIKMLYSLYFVNQIRFSAQVLKDKKWQQRIDKYLVNLGSSRSVEIAQSAIISMPMMIGFLKPIILFPVGVINSMEVKEVEAIIAHELSHVLRNDYIMNIMQSAIEVLFYFNPAVWWISSIVRSEREHSCDDMAVELTHSNVCYAKALLRLGYQQNNANSLVMGFGGSKKKLLLRVQRVLNNSQYKPRVMEKIITSTLLLVLIVGISMGANTNDSPMHTNLESASFPNSIFVHNDESNEIKEYISIDTLPNKDKSCQIMYYNDDKRVDIWKEDGKVIKLWVDGKRIEEQQFSKYQSYIDGAPEMPITPPVPPVGAAPPSPPAPPTPPAKGNGLSGDVDLDGIDSWGNLSALELEKYQADRKRILKEMKEISSITFIDSLHPKLKLVETEDGFTYLNLDENHISNASTSAVNKQLQVKLREIEAMGQALNAQTEELNKQMSASNEQFVAVHYEEGDHFENKRQELETMRELISAQGHALSKQMNQVDKKMSQQEVALAMEQAEAVRNIQASQSAHLARSAGSAGSAGSQGSVHSHEDPNDKLNLFFESELVKDGLIKSEKNYSLKLTTEYFKLNGKKMNSSIHSKYLELLKLECDAKDAQKLKYTRLVKSNRSETTLSISKDS